MVLLKRASVMGLRAAIERVWGDPSYRQYTQLQQQAFAAFGGQACAAEIVE